MSSGMTPWGALAAQVAASQASGNPLLDALSNQASPQGPGGDKSLLPPGPGGDKSLVQGGGPARGPGIGYALPGGLGVGGSVFGNVDPFGEVMWP